MKHHYAKYYFEVKAMNIMKKFDGTNRCRIQQGKKHRDPSTMSLMILDFSAPVCCIEFLAWFELYFEHRKLLFSLEKTYKKNKTVTYLHHSILPNIMGIIKSALRHTLTC